jgi:hypothetical protein
MIKIVMNREIPRSTWLGGTCWRERARLIKSSTMEILRKLVMRRMMLGARERTVRRRSNWREKATSRPLSGFLIERSIKGTTGIPGGAGMFMVPWTDISGKGSDSWAAAPGRAGRASSKRNKGANFFI